jgi:hypothetical protein
VPLSISLNCSCSEESEKNVYMMSQSWAMEGDSEPVHWTVATGLARARAHCVLVRGGSFSPGARAVNVMVRL